MNDVDYVIYYGEDICLRTYIYYEDFEESEEEERP
ncbi:hypothetical protein DXY21_03817 [Bacillus velezensis]|nr:hypothetical protein DXY21_03817 [Bacillus velezensis]